MSQRFQAVRGMNDVLPEQMHFWYRLESVLKQVVHSYGYKELRFPIVEKTALFKRSIGDVTDIVEKEMYTFNDRNGDSLSLRPEGTAACVRAALEHGLLHNQTQRLWYLGPMFRHERPQKGRYRQFYQLGVEAFGFPSYDIELELLLMGARFWQILGLSEKVRLAINTLGTAEERHLYKATLKKYFKAHQNVLDEDSLRRLETNPLRILDSKNEQMQALIKAAPACVDSFGTDTRTHFDALCENLSRQGIAFQVNHQLVRGLDYYTHTVFEWVTDSLGAQGTVCAGGRYDGLVETFGGKPTPAVGFAIGLERLVLLLETLALVQPLVPDIYVVVNGDKASAYAINVTEKLRQRFQKKQIIVHCGSGSFKSQFKKADKLGAKLALIIGEEEEQQKKITLKHLQEDKPQVVLTEAELENYLASRIGVHV